MSALLINGVPVECINQAAIHYHIPATLIIAVLQVENGRPGLEKKNTNGTKDYGPMQINSFWLPQLQPFGINATQLRDDPCTNINVGAWILSQNVAGDTQMWRGVGKYHSHRMRESAPYREKVYRVYRRMMRYIQPQTKKTKS